MIIVTKLGCCDKAGRRAACMIMSDCASNCYMKILLNPKKYSVVLIFGIQLVKFKRPEVNVVRKLMILQYYLIQNNK